MTSALPPRLTERDRRPQPTKSSLTITHIALACSIVFQLLATADAHAQRLRGPRDPAPDPCLENLPAPTPIPPAVRVVQLINCSNQTLLGATNAAGSAGQPLTSVFPREGPWVMAPAGSPNHTNVLTIDIPPGWANNVEKGSIAPNIWARTGCRYDIAANKAQCETGGAGGVYDVSKAHLGPPGGTTITEWAASINLQNRQPAPRTTRTTSTSAP